MGLGKEILAGVGISLGTAAGIRGVRLYQLTKKLVITHRIKVSSLSLKGVTLTIDVVMKNPTASSLTLQYPFLSVMMGNTLLASSEMKDTDIVIKPYSVTEINNITFNLNVLQELNILDSLLTPLATGQPATIRAVTLTRVKFLFFRIPFTTEEDLALNNKSGS